MIPMKSTTSLASRFFDSLLYVWQVMLSHLQAVFLRMSACLGGRGGGGWWGDRGGGDSANDGDSFITIYITCAHKIDLIFGKSNLN